MVSMVSWGGWRLRRVCRIGKWCRRGRCCGRLRVSLPAGTVERVLRRCRPIGFPGAVHRLGDRGGTRRDRGRESGVHLLGAVHVARERDARPPRGGRRSRCRLGGQLIHRIQREQHPAEQESRPGVITGGEFLPAKAEIEPAQRRHVPGAKRHHGQARGQLRHEQDHARVGDMDRVRRAAHPVRRWLSRAGCCRSSRPAGRAGPGRGGWPARLGSVRTSG
jgi:hypothetical protein